MVAPATSGKGKQVCVEIWGRGWGGAVKSCLRSTGFLDVPIFLQCWLTAHPPPGTVSLFEEGKAEGLFHKQNTGK